MKCQCVALIALLLASAHGAAFNFNLRGINKKNADEVMPQLTSMMQAAQTNLAKAQRHHKRVVEKVRRQVVKDFSDEASSVGHGLGSYAVKLEEAAQEIELAMNVTKTGLNRLEKNSTPSSNGWEDPNMQTRARLNAQVGAAERALRRMRHHNERTVHSAEEQAESTLEDSSERLSMKLGDLSGEYDTAKTALESKVAEVIANASADKANATASDKKSAPKLADKDANLDTLEKNLAESLKTSQAAISSLEHGLNKFLGQVDKDVAAKQDKVEKTLQVAQKKEIEKYVGRTQDTAFATSPKVESKATLPKVESKATSPKVESKATSPKIASKKLQVTPQVSKK